MNSNSSQAPPGIVKIRDWLGKRFLIEIKDKRTFQGEFKCVDRQGNIILADTIETKIDSRPIGWVVISIDQVVKIQVFQSKYY